MTAGCCAATTFVENGRRNTTPEINQISCPSDNQHEHSSETANHASTDHDGSIRRLVLLVRHGQREDNIDDEWRQQHADRWDDPPLSARGLRQASETGQLLRALRIDHVVCSPFTRCIQTAHGILAEHPNRSSLPLHIEPGVSEALAACENPPRHLPKGPELQSLHELISADYSPVAQYPLPFEDAELLDGCADRVQASLRELLVRFPGNLMIVSHGSPIAAANRVLTGRWQYVGHCTVSTIEELSSGEWRVQGSLGSSTHLSDRTNLHEVLGRDKKWRPEPKDDN